MKKLALISAIVMSGLVYNTAKAQVNIHVGFHVGPRPVYVPARVVVDRPAPVVYAEPVSYSCNDDYYYLPDVDAYYSVPERCYYYNNGGAWVSAGYLPGAYRNYDWRSARRFEVREARPFMRADYYRARFGGSAFNGRWNERVYDHGYRNDNRFNRDEYRRDGRRFDDRDGNGRERFSENYNGHGHFDRGNHRPGRS